MNMTKANGKATAKSDLNRFVADMEIDSDLMLDEVIAVVDQLLDKAGRLTSFEKNLLESLSDKIEKYEHHRYLRVPTQPQEMLKNLMKLHDLKVEEVAEQTGIALSTLTQFVNKAVPLNTTSRQALSKRFKLSPKAFRSHKRIPKSETKVAVQRRKK